MGQFGTASVAEMPAPRFNITLIHDRLAQRRLLCQKSFATHGHDLFYRIQHSTPSELLTRSANLLDLASGCKLAPWFCSRSCWGFLWPSPFEKANSE
jgi:hypothetical protein